eukprot:m.41376 g.41376  ORF g.41376 m.41376 type:complete len:109 (-) comp8202_c0_seq1:317-643(-)
MAFLGGAKRANVTWEGTLARVNPKMPCQVPFLRGTEIAFWTGVWFLPAVYPRVPRQRIFVWRPKLAIIARKKLLRFVDTDTLLIRELVLISGLQCGVMLLHHRVCPFL